MCEKQVSRRENEHGDEPEVQEAKILISKPGRCDPIQITPKAQKRPDNQRSKPETPASLLPNALFSKLRTSQTDSVLENIPTNTATSIGVNAEKTYSEDSDSEQQKPQSSLCGGQKSPEVKRNGEIQLHRLYSFLTSCKQNDLRNINNHLNMTVSGRKEVLVARSVLNLVASSKGGANLLEEIKRNPYAPNVDDFELRVRLKPSLQRSCPGIDSLLNLLDSKERAMMVQKLEQRSNSLFRNPSVGEVSLEKNRNGHTVEHTEFDVQGMQKKSFSLDEFARLMLIIRDDVIANAAVITATEEEMTRKDLDAGRTRDSYWVVVQRQFNTVVLTKGLNLSGRVDGVESTAMPQIFRSAAKLQSVFRDARAAFSRPRENWQRSRQNDPGMFPQFLSYTEDGELIAESRRAYIMFTAAKLDTKQPDDTFLRLTSETIDVDGTDNTGYDEGNFGLKRRLSLSPDFMQISSQPSSSGERSSKRSYEFDMYRSRLESFDEVLRDYHLSKKRKRKVLEARSEELPSIGRDVSLDKSSSTLDSAMDQEKVMSLIVNAAKTLETANFSPNDSFKKIALKHYENMVKKYDDLCQ